MIEEFPFNNVVWWNGVVEDINDPESLGRVRVRMFGIHTDQKQKSIYQGIPTEELTWAQVASSPMDGPRMHGIGKSPHSLVQGSQVAGIFMDGDKAQIPVVLYCLGLRTVPEEPNRNRGFSDPDGVYPEKLNTPHINDLATERFDDHPIYETLESEKVDGEPDQTAAPEYPYNQVTETRAGHIVEKDDTPNNERIRVIHKSGSYVEMKADGSMVLKSVTDNYLISGGNVNITAADTVNLLGQNLTQIEANLVKLGIDASEPAALGAKILEWLAEHYHNTSQGPSSTPVNRPTRDLVSEKVTVE